MARALLAHASIRNFVPFVGLRRRRRGLSGHARLVAKPAYEKLLAAEPLLRHAIPVLIVIFLVIVALSRFVQLYDLRLDREAQARESISMIATIIGQALTVAEPEMPAAQFNLALQNALADALPANATAEGRQILITDPTDIVVLTSPRKTSLEMRELGDIVRDAQPLAIFGERAGVLDVTMANGVSAYAAVRHLPGRLGSVAVLQTTDVIYDAWRRDVSMNVTIFVGTSGILLIILYGYFAQSARANEADRIYAQTHTRFDTALMRGRCGLWDWDLARGRMFWSQSMFQMLGMPPRDALLSFGEVSRLVHPEDEDLLALAEYLHASEETTVDRMFRVRHADGDWIWLRARCEIVEKESGEPHLIGIAVDITEQMRLAERTKTADIRLRDAIETITEAFVLWDADNRLVMCNSKFQQMHNLPDAAVMPGTPYESVIGAGRQPIVRSRIPAEGRPEEGARSIEAQLEDGRWLQINERRTKDGGFVSVGTDITQIKRHEEKLIEGERRLMATIADLRQSRQTLEIQAQQMVELAEKYAEEKERAEEANRTKSQFLANISHELRTPLNAVIGFSEIMHSAMFGPLGSPKYLEYCHDIHASGTYLLGVINDVLDMARIEAGRLTLDLEDVAVGDLVDESLRIMSGQATNQQIEITSEVADNIELRADRRSIKQILINLLSNAVKFTPHHGRIKVRAKAADGHVYLTIIDSGVGIPCDALKKLGRPFEQVQNQFTKSHGGSGLGLAITRSLAELHGGSMRIRSREAKGTAVTIRLPAEPPVQSVHEAA